VDPPVKPEDDKNWEKELEELSELENYRIRKEREGGKRRMSIKTFYDHFNGSPGQAVG